MRTTVVDIRVEIAHEGDEPPVDGDALCDLIKSEMSGAGVNGDAKVRQEWTE